MEDLRKSTFAHKNDEDIPRFNIFAIISGVFMYIRSKWKAILFWLTFVLIINIVFNPKNTANFISHWYDSFVGTIIDNHTNNE